MRASRIIKFRGGTQSLGGKARHKRLEILHKGRSEVEGRRILILQRSSSARGIQLRRRGGKWQSNSIPKAYWFDLQCVAGR